MFLSGGGGLLSTTEDYLRFAQMLLNGGEANGKRLLKTVDRRVDAHQRARAGVVVDLYGPTYNMEGIGFGLDFAIVLDPAKAKTPRRQELVLLGRRVRHVVLDRSDQRSDRRRHDPEPERQHADRRLAAGAAAVAQAGLRGAGRSTEVG